MGLYGRTLRRLERWLLGPVRPSINDLAALSYGGEASDQDRLHELFDWRVQRATTVARGTVGTAASFATALLLSIFKDELQVAPAVLVTAVGLSLLTASFGLYVLRRLASLSTDYAALLVLLRLVR